MTHFVNIINLYEQAEYLYQTQDSSVPFSSLINGSF
jgi:hypothetical protein